MSEPRIAILGMHLESNAFAPVTIGADFRDSCYLVEDEIVAEAARPAPAMPTEILASSRRWTGPEHGSRYRSSSPRPSRAVR